MSAIESIYSDDFAYLDDSGRNFSILISNEHKASLSFHLQPGYPQEEAPSYTLTTPSIRGEIRQALCEELSGFIGETFHQQCCLYEIIEKARELLLQIPLPAVEAVQPLRRPEAETSGDLVGDVPEIFHGEPFTERRSTFQAHLAVVRSAADVEVVGRELRRNRKIAEATHNIMAYRISAEGGVVISDCDDDGEAQAGSRLLHLLNIMDVNGVVVVISRWFGGILLGPERFKHITNAARNILTEHAAIAGGPVTRTRVT
ncbi:putative Protein IMPACT-A [Hypsibius exemplaris]|uniref:RWD domain-containing protein n=1 Tax=Hypsibius exemplaris TaxID=2072580 RepID=A0A1W0X9G8_HYPEX|nr:putative Protein IMPACT-A [Hypsibius exemplaris]